MLDEALEYLNKRQVISRWKYPKKAEKCADFIFYFKKKDSSFSYEIIVVDDGSKDKTSQVC